MPKYIFIVIGDGFGRGAMMMGEIYARLQSEDMNSGAVWESFSQQKMVEGRGESAGGGTAIATGYVSPPSFISQNTEYQDLYTIMDRAKENGMATGVVTNSFILDATPAAFLTHDDWRLNFDKLSQRMDNSNVDYIAAGGLMRFAPQYYYYLFNSTDARNLHIASKASNESAFIDILNQGYIPYLGLEGAKSFLEQVDSGTFSDEKALCLFTESTMPYEISKMDPNYIETAKYIPSLVDMTKGGILTLSQNPNGFIMVIEEASIDKTAQNESQISTVAQVRLINDTLKVIMGFYNENPLETLVILTADHETGGYEFDEKAFDEFIEWPSFVWNDNADEMTNFLSNIWGLDIYERKVTQYIEYSTDELWETLDENRANLYNYVTYKTSLKLGIETTQGEHSWQLVPCYTTGTGSEEFSNAEGIQDIPKIICEIMGWEMLPEVIEK